MHTKYRFPQPSELAIHAKPVDMYVYIASNSPAWRVRGKLSTGKSTNRGPVSPQEPMCTVISKSYKLIITLDSKIEMAPMTTTGTANDDEDIVFRHMPNANVQVGPRPSSADMKNSSDGSGLSGVLNSLLREAGRYPAELLPNPNFSLYAWRVGTLRDHGFDVLLDPLPNEPAHVNIIWLSEPTATKGWARRIRIELIEVGYWEVLPTSA